tara:strand:+ start:983 stop:1333 length:351 start_codon:yes stop_codon:yes gene_type:complete
MTIVNKITTPVPDEALKHFINILLNYEDSLSYLADKSNTIIEIIKSVTHSKKINKAQATVLNHSANYVIAIESTFLKISSKLLDDIEKDQTTYLWSWCVVRAFIKNTLNQNNNGVK